MLNAIKPLLDSGVITEETRSAIQEAWESQLTEAREEVRAELREEFARRYEHDKDVMVEALNSMVTDQLGSHIQAIAEEKAAIAKDRVRYNNKMTEASKKFNNFMVSKLAEELTEFRSDRGVQNESVAKLEQFVIQALAEELSDFQADRKDVVETKVRLVREGKQRLARLEKKFIDRSSAAVKEMVTKNLRAEMTQLKEDIEKARENSFGRRLFEAFAAEFSSSYLNENVEMKKLEKKLAALSNQLSESKKAIQEKEKLVESKNREIRVINETAQRDKTLSELLKPLAKEKATVMRELLENVQTARLRGAFEKYLPAVLDNNVVRQKAMLSESTREVTGNKLTAHTSEDKGNIVELKKLAGL